MKAPVSIAWQFSVVVLGIVWAWLPAMAEEEPVIPRPRWDVSLDLVSWPGLDDIQPRSGGSFDSLGFGIGLSAHLPVAEFTNSELLLGADLGVAATGSGINGIFDQVYARQLFLGVSGKWLFGDQRNLSLDAGIGYHEVDFAEVDSEWWGSREIEYWSSGRASTYLGATWDIGAGRLDADSGLSLGVRAYFADFGEVGSEDIRFPDPLGPDAGRLEGPIYMFRIAYSGR